MPDAEPVRAFCEEPWTGVLDIQTNRDVTFCPCYLHLRIGNLNDHSLREIWNGPQMIEIRESFRDGALPKMCEGQLCPPVLGEGLSA